MSNELLKNEEGAVQCRHCMKKKEVSFPKVYQNDDLFYARCEKCNYYDPHDFLGLSHKKAIKVWNEYMEPKVY